MHALSPQPKQSKVWQNRDVTAPITKTVAPSLPASTFNLKFEPHIDPKFNSLSKQQYGNQYGSERSGEGGKPGIERRGAKRDPILDDLRRRRTSSISENHQVASNKAARNRASSMDAIENGYQDDVDFTLRRPGRRSYLFTEEGRAKLRRSELNRNAIDSEVDGRKKAGRAATCSPDHFLSALGRGPRTTPRVRGRSKMIEHSPRIATTPLDEDMCRSPRSTKQNDRHYRLLSYMHPEVSYENDHKSHFPFHKIPADPIEPLILDENRHREEVMANPFTTGTPNGKGSDPESCTEDHIELKATHYMPSSSNSTIRYQDGSLKEYDTNPSKQKEIRDFRQFGRDKYEVGRDNRGKYGSPNNRSPLSKSPKNQTRNIMLNEANMTSNGTAGATTKDECDDASTTNETSNEAAAKKDESTVQSRWSKRREEFLRRNVIQSSRNVIRNNGDTTTAGRNEDDTSVPKRFPSPPKTKLMERCAIPEMTPAKWDGHVPSINCVNGENAEDPPTRSSVKNGTPLSKTDDDEQWQKISRNMPAKWCDNDDGKGDENRNENHNQNTDENLNDSYPRNRYENLNDSPPRNLPNSNNEPIKRDSKTILKRASPNGKRTTRKRVRLSLSGEYASTVYLEQSQEGVDESRTPHPATDFHHVRDSHHYTPRDKDKDGARVRSRSPEQDLGAAFYGNDYDFGFAIDQRESVDSSTSNNAGVDPRTSIDPPGSVDLRASNDRYEDLRATNNPDTDKPDPDCSGSKDSIEMNRRATDGVGFGDDEPGYYPMSSDEEMEGMQSGPMGYDASTRNVTNRLANDVTDHSKDAVDRYDHDGLYRNVNQEDSRQDRNVYQQKHVSDRNGYQQDSSSNRIYADDRRFEHPDDEASPRVFIGSARRKRDGLPASAAQRDERDRDMTGRKDGCASGEGQQSPHREGQGSPNRQPGSPKGKYAYLDKVDNLSDHKRVSYADKVHHSTPPHILGEQGEALRKFYDRELKKSFAKDKIRNPNRKGKDKTQYEEAYSTGHIQDHDRDNEGIYAKRVLRGGKMQPTRRESANIVGKIGENTDEVEYLREVMMYNGGKSIGKIGGAPGARARHRSLDIRNCDVDDDRDDTRDNGLPHTISDNMVKEIVVWRNDRDRAEAHSTLLGGKPLELHAREEQRKKEDLREYYRQRGVLKDPSAEDHHSESIDPNMRGEVNGKPIGNKESPIMPAGMRKGDHKKGDRKVPNNVDPSKPNNAAPRCSNPRLKNLRQAMFATDDGSDEKFFEVFGQESAKMKRHSSKMMASAYNKFLQKKEQLLAKDKFRGKNPEFEKDPEKFQAKPIVGNVPGNHPTSIPGLGKQGQAWNEAFTQQRKRDQDEFYSAQGMPINAAKNSVESVNVENRVNSANVEVGDGYTTPTRDHNSDNDGQNARDGEGYGLQKHSSRSPQTRSPRGKLGYTTRTPGKASGVVDKSYTAVVKEKNRMNQHVVTSIITEKEDDWRPGDDPNSMYNQITDVSIPTSMRHVDSMSTTKGVSPPRTIMEYGLSYDADKAVERNAVGITNKAQNYSKEEDDEPAIFKLGLEGYRKKQAHFEEMKRDFQRHMTEKKRQMHQQDKRLYQMEREMHRNYDEKSDEMNGVVDEKMMRKVPKRLEIATTSGSSRETAVEVDFFNEENEKAEFLSQQSLVLPITHLNVDHQARKKEIRRQEKMAMQYAVEEIKRKEKAKQIEMNKRSKSCAFPLDWDRKDKSYAERSPVGKYHVGIFPNKTGEKHGNGGIDVSTGLGFEIDPQWSLPEGYEKLSWDPALGISLPMVSNRHEIIRNKMKKEMKDAWERQKQKDDEKFAEKSLHEPRAYSKNNGLIDHYEHEQDMEVFKHDHSIRGIDKPNLGGNNFRGPALAALNRGENSDGRGSDGGGSDSSDDPVLVKTTLEKRGRSSSPARRRGRAGDRHTRKTTLNVDNDLLPDQAFHPYGRDRTKIEQRELDIREDEIKILPRAPAERESRRSLGSCHPHGQSVSPDRASYKRDAETLPSKDCLSPTERAKLQDGRAGRPSKMDVPNVAISPEDRLSPDTLLRIRRTCHVRSMPHLANGDEPWLKEWRRRELENFHQRLAHIARDDDLSSPRRVKQQYRGRKQNLALTIDEGRGAVHGETELSDEGGSRNNADRDGTAVGGVKDHRNVATYGPDLGVNGLDQQSLKVEGKEDGDDINAPRGKYSPPHSPIDRSQQGHSNSPGGGASPNSKICSDERSKKKTRSDEARGNWESKDCHLNQMGVEGDRKYHKYRNNDREQWGRLRAVIEKSERRKQDKLEKKRRSATLSPRGSSQRGSVWRHGMKGGRRSFASTRSPDMSRDSLQNDSMWGHLGRYYDERYHQLHEERIRELKERYRDFDPSKKSNLFAKSSTMSHRNRHGVLALIEEDVDRSKGTYAHLEQELPDTGNIPATGNYTTEFSKKNQEKINPLNELGYEIERKFGERRAKWVVESKKIADNYHARKDREREEQKEICERNREENERNVAKVKHYHRTRPRIGLGLRNILNQGNLDAEVEYGGRHPRKTQGIFALQNIFFKRNSRRREPGTNSMPGDNLDAEELKKAIDAEEENETINKIQHRFVHSVNELADEHFADVSHQIRTSTNKKMSEAMLRRLEETKPGCKSRRVKEEAIGIRRSRSLEVKPISNFIDRDGNAVDPKANKECNRNDRNRDSINEDSINGNIKIDPLSQTFDVADESFLMQMADDDLLKQARFRSNGQKRYNEYLKYEQEKRKQRENAKQKHFDDHNDKRRSPTRKELNNHADREIFNRNEITRVGFAQDEKNKNEYIFKRFERKMRNKIRNYFQFSFGGRAQDQESGKQVSNPNSATTSNDLDLCKSKKRRINEYFRHGDDNVAAVNEMNQSDDIHGSNANGGNPTQSDSKPQSLMVNKTPLERKFYNDKKILDHIHDEAWEHDEFFKKAKYAGRMVTNPLWEGNHGTPADDDHVSGNPDMKGGEENFSWTLGEHRKRQEEHVKRVERDFYAKQAADHSEWRESKMTRKARQVRREVAEREERERNGVDGDGEDGNFVKELDRDADSKFLGQRRRMIIASTNPSSAIEPTPELRNDKFGEQSRRRREEFNLARNQDYRDQGLEGRMRKDMESTNINVKQLNAKDESIMIDGFGGGNSTLIRGNIAGGNSVLYGSAGSPSSLVKSMGKSSVVTNILLRDVNRSDPHSIFPTDPNRGEQSKKAISNFYNEGLWNFARLRPQNSYSKKQGKDIRGMLDPSEKDDNLFLENWQAKNCFDAIARNSEVRTNADEEKRRAERRANLQEYKKLDEEKFERRFDGKFGSRRVSSQDDHTHIVREYLAPVKEHCLAVDWHKDGDGEDGAKRIERIHSKDRFADDDRDGLDGRGRRSTETGQFGRSFSPNWNANLNYQSYAQAGKLDGMGNPHNPEYDSKNAETARTSYQQQFLHPQAPRRVAVKDDVSNSIKRKEIIEEDRISLGRNDLERSKRLIHGNNNNEYAVRGSSQYFPLNKNLNLHSARGLEYTRGRYDDADRIRRAKEEKVKNLRYSPTFKCSGTILSNTRDGGKMNREVKANYGDYKSGDHYYNYFHDNQNTSKIQQTSIAKSQIGHSGGSGAPKLRFEIKVGDGFNTAPEVDGKDYGGHRSDHGRDAKQIPNQGQLLSREIAVHNRDWEKHHIDDIRSANAKSQSSRYVDNIITHDSPDYRRPYYSGYESHGGRNFKSGIHSGGTIRDENLKRQDDFGKGLSDGKDVHESENDVFINRNVVKYSDPHYRKRKFYKDEFCEKPNVGVGIVKGIEKGKSDVVDALGRIRRNLGRF